MSLGKQQVCFSCACSADKAEERLPSTCLFILRFPVLTGAEIVLVKKKKVHVSFQLVITNVFSELSSTQNVTWKQSTINGVSILHIIGINSNV